MDDHSFDPEFLGSTREDEANDDYDDLVPPTRDPRDDHWFSNEQVNEMCTESGHPEAAAWKEDKDGADMCKTELSVDKARQFLWCTTKTEIRIIRESWGEAHPSFDKLASTLCGPNSKLSHVISEELEMPHEKFCRFLATLCTAAMISQPAPSLCECDLFKREGLLDTKEECIEICRKTESLGVGEDDALWMKVENCFNDVLKKTFLKHRGNNELHIALDDDEHHFGHSKNSDTFGLKRCRHMRDNRLGHTCHTAGLSGSGIPLCAMFQREGETATHKCEAMMKKMFGAKSGESDPNLQGIHAHSDRGHWTPSPLFDKSLQWGAGAHGTVARAPWHPFACAKNGMEQEDVDSCRRQVVSMKGCKDTHCRALKFGETLIRAIACNAGTGSALSLAMSSIHHGPAFDLNLALPKDHKFCFRKDLTQLQRNEKALPLIAGSSDHIGVIVPGLPIHPLTVVQGDTSWFIMRQFSLASSTVDTMIAARAMEITPSMTARDACETMLHAVGRRPDMLPDEPPPNDSAANENEPIDEDANESAEGEDNGIAGVGTAAFWIERANDDDDERAVDDFIEALPGLSTEAVHEIVGEHKHSNPSASIAAIRKKLEAWAHCETASHRKCFWHSEAQLIKRLQAEDPNCRKSDNSKGKPTILNQLIDAEKKKERRAAPTRDGNLEPHAEADETDAVLLRGFQAWCMKKLKAESKKCCRQGHESELPFLKQFCQHGEDGVTLGCKILAIHQTPLVASSTLVGVLDSSDAECICECDDGAIGTLPIELKARLAHSVFHDERSRCEANLGFQAWECGMPSCAELDAESEEFHRWVPSSKECFQLLHHVALRNLRKGLITVGNTKKIVSGVFVNHRAETMAAHRTILEDMHERALDKFHDENESLPVAAPDKVIRSKEMESTGLTPHSFQTSHFIWRKLRICRDSNAPLPLPPCNRILPCVHSHWSNMKGASDAVTRLFWNCRIMTVDWGAPQTVALGKCFQLFSAVLHRWQQIATAKDDLNFHASLHHHRNSRNRHWGYRKLLDHLRVLLIKEANEAAGDASPIAEAVNPIELENMDPLRIHRDNPRNRFEESCKFASVAGGARFPKKITPEWIADQERCRDCPGELHKLDDEKKQKCCVCGTKATCVCLGCGSHHCANVSRDEKLREMMRDERKEVEFLEGVRPPARLSICSGGSKHCSVVSGCFQTVHPKTHRNPLGTVSESSESGS